VSIAPSPETNSGGLATPSSSPVLKVRDVSRRFESAGATVESDDEEESAAEDKDWTTGVRGRWVSKRTVWVAKDLHTSSGHQGATVGDNFWDQL
jgi:hypothetical protein